jgi:hypothetical protein
LLRRKRRESKNAPGEDLVGTPISEAQARQRVCVIGKVTRMTARPTSGEPALAVSISDDTGTITAVWTGRREIGGITLGRRVAIDGVPVRRADHLEFTNPGYTLLPR